MGASSTHPLYDAMKPYWEKGDDSYDGEDAIKHKGAVYLPATSSMKLDGFGTDPNGVGQHNYDAYKMRAVYPEIYKDAVDASIGILHRNEPVIELPEVMEDLRDLATLQGETLEMLLRKINTAQLKNGRYGILGDLLVKDPTNVRPYIATYPAMSIRNWDDTAEDDSSSDINLVVLDESGYVREADLSWSWKKKYRVLALVGPDGLLADTGTYATSVFEADQEIPGYKFEINPNYQQTTLEEIPFAFVNASDIASDPAMPPLNGLANSCLAIYRAEADYRQALFMQGQETFVRIGHTTSDDDEEVRTGTGSRVDVPIGGDAKYVGVSGAGLGEQRQGLENDYARAMNKSGQITDATSRANESGDALRIRMAAQAATLPAIAKAGAAALQKVLRAMAVWYGANPEEVVVTPNLEFTEQDLNGETLVKMVTAKNQGAILSNESIHQYMQENGMTKMTYEDEKKLVDKEREEAMENFGAGFDDLGSNQNGDEEDPEQQGQEEENEEQEE
ncbi:structural phage protein [Vibrio phage VpKK5]|uniref:portal protein n=1 Tax=Vibrio phage VpKK5 TaxID=1538804 RepID=UPI0004F7B64E|nr:portal protein [Vibrio phage VpKK5]AIM40561.1 structural phage protein [Vibrio phage VpKK5]